MNNKGYTLLEILVVLLIITAIFFVTSFTYLHSHKNSVLQNEALFLGNFMQSMQMKSLTSKKESTIFLYDDHFEGYYDNKQVFSHEFPKNVQVDSNFSVNAIKITDNGNLQQGGTVNFKFGKQKRKLVINISLGMYRVE